MGFSAGCELVFFSSEWVRVCMNKKGLVCFGVVVFVPARVAPSRFPPPSPWGSESTSSTPNVFTIYSFLLSVFRFPISVPLAFI